MSDTQTETRLTGYGAAKIVNKVLEEHDLRQIPPQMIYTYLSKGYIKKTEDGGVDVEDLQTWVTKYVAKKENKTEESEA